MIERLVNGTDCAAHFEMPKSTLYLLARQGAIPSVKVPGAVQDRLWFSIPDVEDALQKRQDEYKASLIVPRTHGNKKLRGAVEKPFCDHLETKGVVFQVQVRTRSGIIDVLTDDTIYEIKSQMDRPSIQIGIGQLLLYSAEVPRPNLVLVGRAFPGTDGLLEMLPRLGINPWIWETPT